MIAGSPAFSAFILQLYRPLYNRFLSALDKKTDFLKNLSKTRAKKKNTCLQTPPAMIK